MTFDNFENTVSNLEVSKYNKTGTWLSLFVKNVNQKRWYIKNDDQVSTCVAFMTTLQSPLPIMPVGKFMSIHIIYYITLAHVIFENVWIMSETFHQEKTYTDDRIEKVWKIMICKYSWENWKL